MKKKITSSDIYDINKKSGALLLGKNRLDDYAAKFLSKYCRDALLTPMPLPVDEIISSMGLTVEEVNLSNNLDVFGCCLLLDSEIDIYNIEKNTYEKKNFQAGTILIDPDFVSRYGEGSRRNTLVHEALHWEKDKKYFQILELKNKFAVEKLYPILCRQSEVLFTPTEGKNTKENEVKWLEWQAHRLAPRILMPKNSFIKKAFEIIQNENTYLCDMLIDELSRFFLVSRTSVKYRLLEVGLIESISKYEDYEDIYAELRSENNLVKLTPVEAIKMIENNTVLKSWIRNGRFVYAEGYFVIADLSYVNQKEGKLKLTARAKRNLKKCTINIKEQKLVQYRNFDKDFMSFAFLNKINGIDERLLTFHPKYQTCEVNNPEEAYKEFASKLSSYDLEEEKALIKLIGDPDKSLCECLWFLMNNRGWKYPENFHTETCLHRNYHGKIKNDNYNNMGTDVLFAICVGLKLPLRIIEKLFEKSNNKLNYYNDPDKTYLQIIERMPEISIDDFNEILQELNLKELGSEIK